MKLEIDDHGEKSFSCIHFATRVAFVLKNGFGDLIFFSFKYISKIKDFFCLFVKRRARFTNANKITNKKQAQFVSLNGM